MSVLDATAVSTSIDDAAGCWTTVVVQGMSSQAEVLQRGAEFAETRVELIGKMTEEAVYL